MNENKIYANVLKWLSIGLLISFGIGYLLSNNYEFLLDVKVSTIFWIAAITEFGIAIVFGMLLPKMSATTAKILYLVYSALTGFDFMLIFLIYDVTSIIYVFLLTSIIFGLMALWGKNTDKDLSKMGTYLALALIAVIILTILNALLFHMESMSLILCIVGIVIFVLFIGYDMKKAIALSKAYEEKGEIYGAFQLYLDFINLFIRLLQIFGGGKRDN